MIFSGTTFFGGKHTMDPTPTAITNIDHLTLKDGTYDHFYVSKNPEMDITNIYDNWNFDTVLNAFFNENLDAGNSGFSIKTTKTVVIRIREQGTHDWQVIKTIPVKDVEDFNFSFVYKYCKNHTWYELAIVSTCDGIENSMVSKEVYSDFDGMYIMDHHHSYGTIYDITGFDITRNINNEILPLLHQQYPSVYSNGNANYESGSATASFLKIQDCKTLNHKEGAILRNGVMNFLCDKKAKVIKLFDGRIWMVRITGTPTNSSQSNPLIRQISFDWVEIGDVNNTKIMSRHGLLDVLPEWRER